MVPGDLVYKQKGLRRNGGRAHRLGHQGSITGWIKGTFSAVLSRVFLQREVRPLQSELREEEVDPAVSHTLWPG